MDYYSNEDLYKYFEKEISAASKKRLEALHKEIDELKKRQLQKVEEEVKNSVDHATHVELREINSDHTYEINRMKTENAKVLMTKRQALLSDIFEEVGKKLHKFIKTEAYSKLVTGKINALNARFKKCSVSFSIKAGDELAEAAIKNNFQGKYEIKYVDEIEFGGFLAACFDMGIEIDETIDYKLNEKKQWFYEESNLYIK